MYIYLGNSLLIEVQAVPERLTILALYFYTCMMPGCQKIAYLSAPRSLNPSPSEGNPSAPAHHTEIPKANLNHGFVRQWLERDSAHKVVIHQQP